MIWERPFPVQGLNLSICIEQQIKFEQNNMTAA